jgi:hypothetical protein
VSAENRTPPDFIAAASSPMGRCGSLPLPINRPPPHTADAQGSMNLSVDPLSPQSNIGFSAGLYGITVHLSPFTATFAPIERTHSIVARTSSDMVTPLISVALSLMAAQISRR